MLCQDGIDFVRIVFRQYERMQEYIKKFLQIVSSSDPHSFQPYESCINLGGKTPSGWLTYFANGTISSTL